MRRFQNPRASEWARRTGSGARESPRSPSAAAANAYAGGRTRAIDDCTPPRFVTARGLSTWLRVHCDCARREGSKTRAWRASSARRFNSAIRRSASSRSFAVRPLNPRARTWRSFWKFTFRGEEKTTNCLRRMVPRNVTPSFLTTSPARPAWKKKTAAPMDTNPATGRASRSMKAMLHA